MGSFSIWHWLIVLAVVLLLFGGRGKISSLMGDFGKQIETLARQEQSGVPMSDAQRMTLESIQTRLASNLKVKALNMAEVEFTDLLRKVSQAWQKPLAEQSRAAAAPAAGPRVG